MVSLSNHMSGHIHPLMVSLSNHMSGQEATSARPLTPFDKLRVSGHIIPPSRLARSSPKPAHGEPVEPYGRTRLGPHMPQSRSW